MHAAATAYPHGASLTHRGAHDAAADPHHSEASGGAGQAQLQDSAAAGALDATIHALAEAKMELAASHAEVEAVRARMEVPRFLSLYVVSLSLSFSLDLAAYI